MDRVLIQHSERLFVLSAEESPDETLLLDYGAVELLMTELRNKFHYVVVDVPRSPNACTQQVLQSATDLLLVTDLSLAGMRDTMRHHRHAADHQRVLQYRAGGQSGRRAQAG